MISLYYAGQMYNIEQEPFETTEDSYKRAWYIIKNYGKYNYTISGYFIKYWIIQSEKSIR